MSEEYREAFGSHAYDAEGNFIGSFDYSEFTPETEAQAAWAEYASEVSGKKDNAVDASVESDDEESIVDAEIVSEAPTE